MLGAASAQRSLRGRVPACPRASAASQRKVRAGRRLAAERDGGPSCAGGARRGAGVWAGAARGQGLRGFRCRCTRPRPPPPPPVKRSRIAGQRGCYDGMLMSSLDTIPKRACMDTVLVIDCTGATCTVCELQTYENEWHGMNTGTEACPFAGCGLASSSRFCRRLRSVLSVQRHSCADDSEENRPARTRLARKDRPAPRLPRRTAPRLAAPRRASSRLLAQALHRGASLRRAPGPQCSLTRRPAGPVTRPMPVYRGPGPMP